MKDEIKEILESSRKIINSNRENGFDRIIMLGDDIDKILDCITNLQQENEKVHKELDYADNYNIYLISKIDKAIEYCNYNDESLYTFEPDYDYEENMVDNYEPSNFREDLLNILNSGE